MNSININLRKQISSASLCNCGSIYLRKQILFLLLLISVFANAQTPKTYTSSETLLQLKKLNVLGSVLYIAAHPDDENTRLLAYLANEKMYRTGYLSLTRGDGGQNLVGDELGVDLGLIRTQELLAARRIDGAEQFFSRAFDFGYSKNPEEALRIWGHDKILSDVVWVIRQFKPDVIITRFPTTGEGGHGHHTASAILAEEAFDAAADPTKFPEQLKYVTVWQAKRLLWNTFNFGSSNTQKEDQLKIDVGQYNPLLGKSYGELAALSRSQHKSQGFGVPAQRGSSIEYFKTIKGIAATTDLFDGVNANWSRSNNEEIEKAIADIIAKYAVDKPQLSLKDLVALHTLVQNNVSNVYWQKIKLNQIENIIEQCAGIFIEASTNTPYAVQGDSLKINLQVINRQGDNVLSADAKPNGTYIIFDQLKKNIAATKTYTQFILPDAKLTQPYWLADEMSKGSFNVSDQSLIGKAQNDPMSIDFSMMIEGKEFTFTKPVRYKYTDPVKGEIFQPVNVIPNFSVTATPQLAINKRMTNWEIKSYKNNNKFKSYIKIPNDVLALTFDTLLNKESIFKFKGGRSSGLPEFDSSGVVKVIDYEFSDNIYKEDGKLFEKLHLINYDHIPTIIYTTPSTFISKSFDIKKVGSNIGYIVGAGDKVPQALEQMGYKVTLLKETDITANNLKQFDAIVTGVRTYNTNEWMNNVYDVLMQYVKDGGVMVTQYNTSNSIGPVKAKIAPYPFTIGRNRITDEEAKVNFLLPNHAALNYPNKITQKDFEGWIQERSTYHAENIDSNYQRILSMQDPGEKESDGSLIIANYGKGKFVYTGLVFFRELPAGVPGAYRLFANLLAKRNVSTKENKLNKETKKLKRELIKVNKALEKVDKKIAKNKFIHPVIFLAQKKKG
jgi:LmbE family N-acetylglucosaminyl deacetylase